MVSVMDDKAFDEFRNRLALVHVRTESEFYALVAICTVRKLKDVKPHATLVV